MFVLEVSYDLALMDNNGDEMVEAVVGKKPNVKQTDPSKGLRILSYFYDDAPTAMNMANAIQSHGYWTNVADESTYT